MAMIRVHVVPNAKIDKVVGELATASPSRGGHGGAIKIKLCAPAVEGKANAALIAFLLAWPLARFVPRRRTLGWILAIAGSAGYVWFSAGPIPAVLGAFAVAVIGFALIRGHGVRAA